MAMSFHLLVRVSACNAELLEMLSSGVDKALAAQEQRDSTAGRIRGFCAATSAGGSRTFRTWPGNWG